MTEPDMDQEYAQDVTEDHELNTDELGELTDPATIPPDQGDVGAQR